MSDHYDFVIVGGGPAGLAAAITGAQSGRTAVILEKGSVPGPDPRGESMPYRPLMDRLLGPGFLDRIKTFLSYSREFHSPEDMKSSIIKIKEPYYFFEWRDLIDALVLKAGSLGVEIICDAEVTAVTSNGVVADGVIYRKDGSELKISGSAVLGCGGRSCPVAAHYGIDGDAVACPTVKFRGKNAPISKNGISDLQFYTVLPGIFESVPDFPPAFAYVFPVGDGNIEAGLMLRLSQFDKLDKVQMPSDEEIMRAWEEAKAKLPGFSELFRGTQTVHEQLTSIQNRKLIEKNIMPGGGAVLIGDSMGMVDANGSAGLFYAMAQAEAWTLMLAKELNEGGELWSSQKISGYYSSQNSWDFYKYIKNSFGAISIFERLLFKTFGTVKKLNAVWPFIVFLLRRAS